MREVMKTPRPDVEKIKTSEYKRAGHIPIFDQGSESVAGYTDNMRAEYHGKLPAILFGDHTLILNLVKKQFALGADGVQVLEPEESLFDRKFFYYALKGLKVKSYGYERHLKYLRELEITCPDINDQKRIASILSTFDNKIELNNKISKNLEQTAQAIFKEWFIKFKYPGHEKVKIVDSELGKIPKRWEVKSWGDLEGVSVAGDWGEGISSDVCAESVYILRGTDIPALKAGSKGECPIRYLAKESLQKRKLKPGDIVVEISGGSKDQPTGRSLYITEDILKRFELPLVCTSFCRLVRSNNILSSILMFLHLDRLYKTKKIWNYQLQSTGISNFQYGQFREYEKLIVPPPEIQEIVSDVLISCIQYSHRNENQKLAALRDLLLPKLMSGEIRV